MSAWAAKVVTPFGARVLREVLPVGRAERRAWERTHRNSRRESKMTGAQLVVMGIVTFAMAFSSLGMILAYGGREAAIVTIVVFVIVIGGVLAYRKLREMHDGKVE